MSGPYMPKYLLVRADGNPIMGDYAFLAVETASEWDEAENDAEYRETEEPVTYLMYKTDLKLVATRTIPAPEDTEEDVEPRGLE